MRFVPTATNPCCPEYSRWDYQTKHAAEQMVLRWNAQSGTEYSCLQSWMVPQFVHLLETMGEEIAGLHTKMWKTVGETPRT